MSASAANAQSITSTSGTTIFDPSANGQCATIVIACESASTSPVLVNVAGLHTSGEFFKIEAGKDFAFRAGVNGIGIVTAKVASGTATIGWAKAAVL
jgi:hypothetical protein